MKTEKKANITTIPFLGDIILSGSRTLIGIALGLLTSGILIALSNANPLVAYGAMIKGAFGDIYAFCNVLVRVSPLLLGGMGVAIGNKAGIWNTGIEGYMYLGAIGSGLVAIQDWGLPSALHILLAVIAGMAFAAAWGLIPGYLRAHRGVNEVTCTIMLNYVAIYLTNWLVSDAGFFAESGAFFPMSKIFQDSAQLPILLRGTSLHPGVFVGIIVCLIFFFLLKYTPFGFRTRMLGGNPNAARYSGVDIKKQIILVMVLGAMLGGLGGAIEVIGLRHRVYSDFVTGVGYECIAVALLVGGNPVGVIFAGFFFAILKVGGATMSIETGVSSSMTSIIMALCVLFVIGVGLTDNHRVKKKSNKADAVAVVKQKEE